MNVKHAALVFLGTLVSVAVIARVPMLRQVAGL